ncbi:MAG: DUF2976 domain-containing protein [Gammaproteobacteria bacterium]|uniref:DUF2976 domain-containing protein n=1 Tax=uncultured Pseudacidovorax sp. TaxID=679313 RepID=UPI0025F4496D|nr:DUF2976 domain-containing protein [uncultured Pseudacidovorax sp.]
MSLPLIPAQRAWFSRRIYQRLALHGIVTLALIWLSLHCGLAMAELPQMSVPTEGLNGQSVKDGDVLSQMGAYFKLGLTIFGTIVAAVAAIYVASGGLTKWKEYTSGRVPFGDLKEYFIMGVLLVAFVILMITLAIKVLG